MPCDSSYLDPTPREIAWREAAQRLLDFCALFGTSPATEVESGGSVRSLTESVMGITAGLFAVARALENVAHAIEIREAI